MPDEGWNGVEAKNEVITKSCSISENCTERRIVGTLTSALPEQLKSILTEAEVEQFVTRIYSRLVSDGIIGSITLDSVTQNKELTEDQSQCRDTPSISVSPSEEVFRSSGDRRDSEKETLKRELERLRELAKNADKTTQGKSTQTSPTTALPETSSEDLSKVKPSETFGSPLEKAIVQNSTNFQEQSSSTTSISDTSDSKDTKAVENDAAGVTRLSLAVTSPLSPSLQQVSSSPAYTSTPPPPPPPPPPPSSPFLNHRFQNNIASISQPSFSIPPPPPLPACSTSTQSFSSQHTITSLPTIPPPPPPPPLPPPTLQSATDEMHIAPPAPPPPPPPPSPAPSIGRQTSSVPSAPLPPPPPPPPPTQTALFNLIPPPPPPPPPPLPASSLSSASSITGLHAGPPIPPPPPPPPPPTSTSSIGSVSGGPAPPPPPPPPTPMIGVPPPPPPPPARMVDIPGGSPFPPPPPPPSMGVPGVPPPPAPGTQGTLQQPTPLPTPPVGGWNPASRACMRKEPLCPEIPMKPLYWTRILVPATPTEHGSVDDSDSAAQIPLWAELEEEKNLDMKEFANLFSRQVTARKPVKEADEASKPSKIQPAKILDSERSKAVGILEKSLRRVDFSEVENAVYNLDTSVVSLEVLQQIYKILPTQKELQDIKAFEECNPNVPLDRPEIFLKKLSGINHFSERIACLTFQSEFQDTISSISSKLTNLRSTCDFLRNSRSLKKVIALILTLGNYMNGGNRTRGQADGFGLEILEKLKDVKSNIPGVTLLHYVVRARLAQEKDHNCEEPLPLPIPEPADIEAASTINFENISAELETLKAKLRVCIDKCEIIVNTDSEQLGPFKEKMDSVFREAAAELANEQEALLDAKNKFKAVMQFYQYTPKGSKNIDAVDPNSFFILWLSFCQDFKDIWKKEQQRMRKERIEEMRKKYESKTKVEKRKISATGLKARLQKLSRK